MTAMIATDDNPHCMKQVLVVDDHPMMRAGVAEMIGLQADLEICGQADNLKDAIELVLATKPDLLMLDISLGEESSLYQIKNFKELMPNMLILVVSMHDETGHGYRAIHEGADGYISKSKKPQELLSAVRNVLSGEGAIPTRVLPMLLDAARGKSRGENDLGLSRREFEVYEFIGIGRTTREIAIKLGISPRTVEAHKENLKKKLGLKSAAELAKHAAQYMQGGSSTAGV